MQRVPVLHKDGTPLMPCKPAKARKLLRDGKAIKRWTKEGVFYIQLTFETSKHTQPMCLGIDPGAKFDGYAVLTDQEIVTSGMFARAHRRLALRWAYGLYCQTLGKRFLHGECCVVIGDTARTGGVSHARKTLRSRDG